MLEAKYAPLLLSVTALLMVSCRSAEHTAEQGAKWGENAAVGKLETFDFTLNSTNMTHFAYGITATTISVLLYGSNFVPIKRIETGDGMFFQWITCAAIWIVSMVGDLMLQSPKFHPFAMLGGVIWATGNIAAVPIVKAIGLALGILIWSSSSLLMGWASSKFGWFGITAQDVSRPMLNYFGAGLCLLSGLIFFFVRTDVELHPNSESIPLLIDRVKDTLRQLWTKFLRVLDRHRRTKDKAVHVSSISVTPYAMFNVTGDLNSIHHAVSQSLHLFRGCLLAVVSGMMYGSSFAPILYIKSHSSCHDSMFHGASVYELDYVYAQCSGIFIASTVYFAIYCAAMNNRPKVYSRAILPGLLSGLMWALATYCWFLANNYLSTIVTFPIVSAVSASHLDG
ncbi:hypothetical protein L3Q82_020312 [Scortum barcoo]|uniref:Uncharacterized protein n=1 Tax=Scortum barcoo TaxID=214431 RepID=A0ACB8VAA2_9TELE|nr:hypothetical protein L3Q82_020312 [Scortum barcoo]